MAGLSTGAGAAVVKVYHEKSMILPDVSRVLACLYEKDVKFECVKDSYKDILRLQATRSVPVPFYDGPTFLQESRAICRYIAETYEQRGYPFLLGKDVLERASIEQWLRHEEHAFDPPSRALFCHLAFPFHDEDNDDINREKRKLEEVLEVYEQRLGESEFLAGNEFTLADLVHLPNTHHIVTSEKFTYLYDSRKNVQRWWNTISARDSWQQVLWDMKSVEEQYQKEELEQQQQLLQQQQWQTEPPPTSDGRSIDELAKTAGVDRKAPPSTPKQTPADATNAIPPVQGAAPSADGISDKQSDKSTMDERAPEMTPSQAPPSDTRPTSASIQEEIMVPRGPSDDMLGKTSGTGQIATPAASKSTPARGEVPDVRDTGNDTTEKPAVDTKAAPTPPRQEPVSQTTEQIKGVAPTSHGITGDEVANIAMADESATPPAPEAVKPSVAEPRGMPTTPRPAPTPDTQPRTTSDQASDQAPPLPIKEDDFLVNANQNNTGEAQVTSTDGPSKLQMQSDQNKPISSKDIGKRNNETVSYRSSATSRETLPSVPEKSMGENQLQGDKSSISLQDNVKQGSEAALSVSGTEQPKKRDLLANADQNSGKTPGEALQMSEEQTTSDTQQMKSNTSNSKSDGPSKPTQFDGNEGNLPESQRRGSSTNP